MTAPTDHPLREKPVITEMEHAVTTEAQRRASDAEEEARARRLEYMRRSERSARRRR